MIRHGEVLSYSSEIVRISGRQYLTVTRRQVKVSGAVAERIVMIAPYLSETTNTIEGDYVRNS